MNWRLISLLILVLIVSCAGELLAQEEKDSGVTLYSPVETSSITLPDGRVIEHFTDKGFVVDREPEEVIRSENCSGTRLKGPSGDTWVEAGYCYQVEPNGDVVWLYFQGDEKGGRYQSIVATGQLVGLKFHGTSKVTKRWPDGKYEVTWEGLVDLPK